MSENHEYDLLMKSHLELRESIRNLADALDVVRPPHVDPYDARYSNVVSRGGVIAKLRGLLGEDA